MQASNIFIWKTTLCYITLTFSNQYACSVRRVLSSHHPLCNTGFQGLVHTVGESFTFKQRCSLTEYIYTAELVIHLTEREVKLWSVQSCGTFGIYSLKMHAEYLTHLFGEQVHILFVSALWGVIQLDECQRLQHHTNKTQAIHVEPLYAYHHVFH